MNGVQISPWRITRISPVDDYSETLFSLGNGRLGVRGFPGWRGKDAPQEHAIFRAGFFSAIKPAITDMVQLPDVLTLRPLGEEPDINVLQELDMRIGVLTQSWDTPRANLRLERAACMADEQLLLQRLTLTAKKAGFYTLESMADALTRNLPVHDDQTIASTELAQLLAIDSITTEQIRCHTLVEKEPLILNWLLLCDREAERWEQVQREKVITRFFVDLKAGESVTVEKRVRVLVGEEDPLTLPSNPWQANADAWADLWHDCDIEIEADDPDFQGALRYNIFQMLCNNASWDRRVSIGARGLTHGRYKGNTFWDTEIFLLPFYLWTRPQAAKNLLLYRVDRLPDAMALAQKQNLDGARFPWMCSNTGMEQCESWDIGLCEVHITADVAYAVQRYGEVTGDEEFMRDHAAHLYRETARYWLSRLTYEPSVDRYSSFFVKGPDEYCGAAINNTFTNYLARNNLTLAIFHGELEPLERERMEGVRQRVMLLYDESRDLFLQDETLNRLPPFVKQDDTPSYKSVCFDRMQRYRALKQADLVLLMTLFPYDFTLEQQRNVFFEYEPITLHDSTLSYGVHAQLALRLSLWDKGEDYLRKAIYLDLWNIMGNTGYEGVHMGAMGAAWQAVVFGALGLWSHNGKMMVDPKLPPSIHRIKLRICHRGSWYRVEAFQEGTSIQKEE
ncbi:MAG: glycoside hydrolase family 65 protein [Clostridiales bacterium]|nr:glycoside hydrolase family 65 protein [Clostridiales bacterium]